MRCAQHEAECAGVREQELKARPVVEKAGADDVQNVDGVVEQIAGDDGQFKFARAVLARGIGGMHEQRHIQVGRSLEHRPELLGVQIGAADVGGDVAADEAEIAHAAAKLGRGGGRILQRQERPGAEPVALPAIDCASASL